jgi:hypothetical protein
MGTHTRFPRLRRVLAGAVAVTGLATSLAVGGSSAPASAAIQAQNYVLRTAELVPNAQGRTGNWLACPPNHRVVSGGAFWHPAGQAPNAASAEHAWLMGSTATADGRGWYASGYASFPNASLTVLVQCLPDSQVGGAYVTRTAELVPNAQGTTQYWLACPPNHRAVTGGAFWHPAGKSPQDTLSNYNALITGSTATSDGKGWYAAGDNFNHYVTTDGRLTMIVQCLPEAQVGGVYVTRTADLVPNAQGKIGTTQHWLACPRNYRAISGGGFWHRAGQAPNPASPDYARLMGSTATADGRGWYASGYAYLGYVPNPVLTMVVQCLYTGSVVAPVDDYLYRSTPWCDPDSRQCPIDPWGYTKRQCVSFVAWRLSQDNISFNGAGNAEKWDDVARERGKIVDNTPAIGAVAQWDANQGGALSAGHVAYVTAVNADGTVNVEEYNQNSDESYHQRFSIRAQHYIHF